MEDDAATNLRPPLAGAGRLLRFLTGESRSGTFRAAQFLFIRLLALSTFVAFWSMSLQITGLVGENGILPAVDFLETVRAHFEAKGEAGAGIWRLPSLFWWGASDAALRNVCAAGMGLSAALFVGLAPRLVIPLLWFAYLSIISVGQVFLGYQWDALILEALFVGWFFAPWQLWPGGPGSERAPSWAGRWLVWLLVFKLMFLSGWVKVQADAAWRNLEALDYHFWTQPIPNALAWYADKLPEFAKELGVVFTLVAEFPAPLLVFAPRRLRHVGAVLMIGLQITIGLTGTFGFFNLLTIALCVALFDDAFFEWLSRGRWSARPSSEEQEVLPKWQWGVRAATVAVLGGLVLLPATRAVLGLPAQRTAVEDTLAPFRTINSYGLFARMTKTRPEILVEGSDDGETWWAYDFRWKPTAVDEPLRMTTFHMPRLDWQMWFAALGDCRRNRWYHEFATKLLLGSPEVEALLEETLDNPPKYIRSRYFEYRFGGSTTWTRVEQGTYCPTFTLSDDGQLRVADR